MPLVYDELRRIAHRQRAARGDHTLTTTALVHEVFLRLVDRAHTDMQDRAHFFAVTATAMRHLLVDHAREQQALKRGGDRRRVELDANVIALEEQAESLLELHDALDALAAVDARLARVVECRFFGGLTDEETAAALGVTARTVRRDWVKARALLRVRLDA